MFPIWVNQTPLWLPLTLGGVALVGTLVGIWLKHHLDGRRERRTDQSKMVEELAASLRELGQFREHPPVGADKSDVLDWSEEREDAFEQVKYQRNRLRSKALRLRLEPLELLRTSFFGPEDDDMLVGYTRLTELELRRALVHDARQALAAFQRGDNLPAPIERVSRAAEGLLDFHRRGTFVQRWGRIHRHESTLLEHLRGATLMARYLKHLAAPEVPEPDAIYYDKAAKRVVVVQAKHWSDRDKRRPDDE